MITNLLGGIDSPKLYIQVCKNLSNDIVLKMNLISFRMRDFYVILGIDWLSTHRATMDYFIEKIVFQKLGFSELEFENDHRVLPTYVISTLEAKRLLYKGCEAYLARVVDKSSSKVTLDSVLVVQEFPNVFSKDLPSLSPDRELALGIELLSDLALISIPSYRMAPNKLKELKT